MSSENGGSADHSAMMGGVEPPVFIEIEAPAAFREKISLRRGDLLVFGYEPEEQQNMAVLGENVRIVLQSAANAGVTGVTAVILSNRLTLKVISEEQMAANGWMRAPGWQR